METLRNWCAVRVRPSGTIHAQVYEDSEADAIVGVTAVAGLLPAAAPGLPGCDAPRLVPLERWDVEDVQRGSPVPLEARFGAFVDGADAFDGAIFGISRFVS